MATNLPSLKATRTKYRNILGTEFDKGQSLVQDEENETDRVSYLHRVQKCASRMRLYSDKLEKAKNELLLSLGETDQQLSERIIEDDCQLCSDVFDCCCDLVVIEKRLCKEDEEFQKGTEFDKMFEIQQKMQKQMKMMMITQQQQIEQQQQQIDQQQMKMKEREQSTSVKLPKLDIPSFNGDKLNWMSFWDSFECTVHNNRKLSNIEKFSYLNSKLTGEAKSAISGLALSNDNYLSAITLLRDRFGDTQAVVDMHYSELIHLHVASNTSKSLRTLMDSIEKHLRSLQALQQNVDQSVFVSMITSKLPKDVLLQLEVQKGTRNKWSVTKLRNLLDDYVVARERAEQQSQEESKPRIENTSQYRSFKSRYASGPQMLKQSSDFEYVPNRSTAEALFAGPRQFQSQRSYSNSCRYCELKHWSDECPKYRTIEERKAKIKGSCYICLKQGHVSRECVLNKICIHCGERNVHHRSLCPKKTPLRTNSKESVHMAEETTQGVDEMVAQENVLISSGEMVLMQTATTEVRDPERKHALDSRILLDSGSQRTYITESLASKLNLKYGVVQEITLATFGSDKPKVIKTPTTDIEIKLKNGQFMKISANVVPNITGSIQRKPVNFTNRDTINCLFTEFDLADTIPDAVESSTVDILIGNDYYLDIILSQKVELQPGLYLLGSKLGWILSGRTPDTDRGGTESNLLILTYGTDINGESNLFTSADKSLPTKPELEDFWNLESIGITDDYTTSNEDKAMQHFQETVKFRNGRYEVKWPWKDESPELPENYGVAVGRLRSLVTRLKDKPELLKSYDDVLQDQQRLGVIEKVTGNMNGGIKHYIPHHAVIKPSSTTTKLRLVYDASAKTPNSKSLNECLYRGPVLLRDLCGMLLRFRLHEIALVADIEKAFLQIGLQDSERDSTRFVWLKDYTMLYSGNANIQEYRFCRVPFGVISSPFLLGATIEHHLSNYGNETSETIKKNIYMDNVITGTDCVEKALNLYTDSKRMFLDASMNLRDWVSNNREVMNKIPKEDRSDCENMNVLGLKWNVTEDTMTLKSFNAIDSLSNATKREVLKQVASIFDPLGLFAPVHLQGKLFLQQLWNKHIEWDEHISSEDEKMWSVIKVQLQNISSCKFERNIGLKGTVTRRLLCFCDASKAAYATSVYLHQANECEYKNDLVFAKTRLAPTKGMSIPRLELMAVLIGSRCVKYVKEQLQLDIAEVHLWTDSQCVLKWLHCEKNLTTFVENRVREIRATDITFHYVPSKENPADIASRGTVADKLKEHQLWWHGPQWLLNPDTKWQRFENESTCEQVNTEFEAEIKSTKKSREPVLVSNESDNGARNTTPFDMDIGRFSTLTRLLRVTALVQKFISKLQRKAVNDSLTNDEIDEAKNMWIHHIQEKHYQDIINSIHNQKANNTKKQLGVYMDEDGCLRCKGRLENANLTEAARLPVLLPKQDKFTRLIIENVHKHLFHAGVSQTLSQIRYQYWIPHGRTVVKSVLKKCSICRRHEGGPYQMPTMPSLPKKRVTESVPFTYTGIDYFGPLYVKAAREQKKVWVCLYTCLVTRVIHLELMQNMSSEEFLLGLRRFIAQRGKPQEITSDNATQFKLASETLNLIWGQVIKDKDVVSYVSSIGVKWSFIVQLAPWMGGFYERLVGLVKRALRKTLGRVSLTNEQLLTVLKEVEAVINTRPLVYVGDDIDSNITLTPNHFTSLNPRTGIPQADQEDDVDYTPNQSSADKLLMIWKKGQKHLNNFWQIWRDEYLLSLRERYQTNLKSGKSHYHSPARVGDIVLVKEQLPRGSWKIGKIVQLVISRDGATRSAKVMLSSRSIIGRPLNLLYPVECPDDEGDQTREQPRLPDVPEDTQTTRRVRTQRKAAIEARKRLKDIKDLD